MRDLLSTCITLLPRAGLDQARLPPSAAQRAQNTHVQSIFSSFRALFRTDSRRFLNQLLR